MSEENLKISLIQIASPTGSSAQVIGTDILCIMHIFWLLFRIVILAHMLFYTFSLKGDFVARLIMTFSGVLNH